jgi:tetratricopeptide (TPR) repeat protein
MTFPEASDPIEQARSAAARGAWRDVRALLEPAAARGAPDGVAALLLADACLWTGDPARASNWLDVAEPQLARAGDRPGARRTIIMRGAAAYSLGQLDQAADAFSLALSVATRDGDALMAARATNNLGAIASLRGQFDAAIASFQLTIPAYQRTGNARGLAESWHNLAMAYRTRGDLDASDDAEQRAIEFATEAANPRLVSMAQVGRAEIALRRGDPALARRVLERAVATFAELGDDLLLTDAEWLLAETLDALSDAHASDATFARASVRAEARGHARQGALVQQAQARVALRRGDVLRARTLAQTALATFARIGSLRDAEELSAWLVDLGVR